MVQVAVVVLDTLRKDAFEREFDWLVDDGLTLSGLFSNSHWTVPAHAALFTGVRPVEAGVYHGSRRLDTEEETIAEWCRDRGIRTHMFTENAHVSPEFGFDRGFDQVFETSPSGVDPLNDEEDGTSTDREWWLSWQDDQDVTIHDAPQIIRAAIDADRPTLSLLATGIQMKLESARRGGATDRIVAQLRETDETTDELVFVNLMGAHQPYRPPSDYRTVDPVSIDAVRATLFGPEESPERIRQAYRDGVRWLSESYRQVHQTLIDRGADVIVTVADHGEALGEAGHWEHQTGLEPNLVHVPGVVTGPDVDAGHAEKRLMLSDLCHAIQKIFLDEELRRAISNAEQSADLPGKAIGVTEHHGLDPGILSDLSDEGVDVGEWSRPRYGLVYPYGYAWRRHGEDRATTVGDVPKTVEADLDAVTESMPPVVTEEDTIDESVQARLSDLGYT